MSANHRENAVFTDDGECSQSTEKGDPLLECLEQVAAWHRVDISREVVLAGLPVEKSGRLTPPLLERAARRVGFHTQVVKRKLNKIPAAVLPVILLLKDNRAGVLLPGGSDDGLLFHLAGQNGENPSQVTETLNRDYSGYAILLQSEGNHMESAAGHQQDMDTPVERARWFWRTLWAFRADYLRLLPSSFLVNLFAFAMPFFTMLVYNRVVPNNAEETLWVLTSGVVAIFTFEFILRLARGYILKTSGREMDMVLASQLYEQILSLEMKARPASSGSMAGRAKSYEVLRDFFVSAALLALTDVPFALLMITVMFFIGGQMIGWISVFSVCAAIVFQLMIQRPLREAVVSASESGLERQSFVTETINGMETIKASNAEGALQHRFETMVTSSSQKDVRSHWYSMLGDSTTKGLINLSSIAVIVASVYQIQTGAMSMGAMIACVMLGARIMTPLAMAAGLMTRLQQTLHALRGLNAMMALPRETGDGRKFIQRRFFRPDYQFKGVTLSYPNQQVSALHEITLHIREGERIALLGRMGSGKSTLLRVLAKLYEPTQGEVILDGIGLAQYHPAVVRSVVGYLPQGAAIFCGNLRENVTLGARNISDEEIMEAISMAGLGDFVKRHPQGIYAPVGEQGSLLSGGQRQALSLARVLLRKPKMLLLDEPTSSLDLQAEEQFIACLKTYLDADPSRSLMIATHKNNVLELVSRIIVLHEGKVHRDGPIAKVIEDLSRKAQPAPQTVTARSATTASVK